MKINCISSWALRRQLDTEFPLAEMSARVKERYGFADVEICQNHIKSMEAQYLDEIVAGLQKTGGRCVNMPINICDISAIDDKARRHDFRVLETWFAVAEYIGCPRVRLNTEKGNKSRPNRLQEDPQVLQRVADSFKYLCDVAEKYGVQIVLENHGGLSRDVNNILWLTEQVGPRLGLCPDLANFPEEVLYDSLEAMMPKASIVHCKYAEKNGQVPWDWPRSARIVKYSNFNGPISVEIDGETGNGWDMIDKVMRLWESV